jgi:hypothetical protein
VDIATSEALLGEGGATMWDTVYDALNDSGRHLSHDMPCQRCGHALHTFLGCDDSCDCQPALMPGEQQLLTV